MILTTFSREPLLPLVEEFSRRYQGIEVQIIHRRAQSSVQLLNKSYIQNIDLVLSSSPYLMQNLAQSGKLAALPEPMQTPEWLKPYALPMTEHVATIGYSGAGLVWNQDYLKTHQLPEPKQFSDLAKAGLFWACHHEYTSTLWHHADDGGKHTGQIWLAKRMGDLAARRCQFGDGIGQKFWRE